MSYPDPLSEWRETVSRAFPALSRPQATVLALWSYGMVMAKSCGITLVCAALALQLGTSEANLVQRLREWCYASKNKRGAKRQDLDVSTCFAPLLRWILEWWPANEMRLVIAVDASTLGKRFTVLCVSVLYRGCAIPVAWRIVGAEEKGSWRPIWIVLLSQVQESVPTNWTVLVLTDRGVYAPWLFTHIVTCGWHPFMRINQQGNVRPVGEENFRGLVSLAPKEGTCWSGEVECFSERDSRLRCTLLARWDKGYKEVWLIVTDLTPEQAEAAWYGMRSWIECGFKDTKRGGWQWHQTKMTDPKGAERLWLAIAVATLWVVSVGGQADATLPVSSLEALPDSHIARRKATGRSQPRMISCFARGLLLIVGTLIRGEGLLLGRFVPEPWPCVPPAARKMNVKAQGHQPACKASP